MPGQDQTMLSYSLKAQSGGCAWGVLDADGEVVAHGAATDRAAAQAAIRSAYKAASAAAGVALAA